MSLSEEHRAYLQQHREAGVSQLLAWFAHHARDLPWRHERTPYRVWVAEVMLQQTQAETVRDYYTRFITRFPTIQALANASQEEALKMWEGLGYYARARHLHQAARQVMAQYQGELPSDVKALRTLPGIGPYTAGAIASIAFGIPTPAVDGNARRVIARLLGIPAPDQAMLREAIRLWMPKDAAGAFTEALMELGATLCLPHTPHCLHCPWRELCQAHKMGRQETIPTSKPRKRLPHYDVAAAVILRIDADGVHVLVAQRLAKAMLGGLWEFPGGKREKGETLPEALRRELQEEMGIEIEVGPQLTVIKHTYTHFRITLYAFICHPTDGTPRCIECQNFQWATLEEIQSLPMAVTDRKIADALATWLSTTPSPQLREHIHF